MQISNLGYVEYKSFWFVQLINDGSKKIYRSLMGLDKPTLFSNDIQLLVLDYLNIKQISKKEKIAKKPKTRQNTLAKTLQLPLL